MIWEAAGGQEYQNLTGHTNAITDLSWRRDSRILASCSEDGSLKTWNVDQGKMFKSWSANKGTLSVEFGMNGNLVSSGRDNLAKVWDLEGKTLAQTEAHPDMVMDAVLSFDGKRIITGDWSGVCNVYDATNGKKVGSLSLNPLPLDKRVAAAAQEAVEKKKLVEAAAAVAATFKKQFSDAVTAEKAAQDKANQIAADVPRLDQLRQKLEKEVPQLQRSAQAAAKKAADLRRKVDEAKAEAKKASEAAAKAKDGELEKAKKQVAASEEKVKLATAELTKADADAAAADKSSKDAAKQLADTQKLLPEQRNRIKPSKDQVDRAVAARTAAEKALAEKLISLKQAEDIAAAAEQAAQQAAADKAEFDKQGKQAGV